MDTRRTVSTEGEELELFEAYAIEEVVKRSEMMSVAGYSNPSYSC